MNKNLAIKVQNLTKNYKLYDKPIDRLKESLILRNKKLHKEFSALKNVDFEIKKGATVGILGSNGAGKSTLLKIITGVVMPSNGHVNTHGKIASLLELGAGFDPEMTGYENIYLNGSLLGFSQSEIDDKIDEIIEFADIGEFIYQPMKVYSSGMFVRLAFATQIATNPDILIIDEALAVGDAYFVHKCMLHFHKLKESGVTILLVTHDATAVRTLCDTAIWLKNGQIEDQGDITKVVDGYLKFITKQQAYINKSEEKIKEEPEVLNHEHEMNIPNIDDRFGDQLCSIVGLGLFDENLQRTTHINNNSFTTLKLTIKNNSLSDKKNMLIGYTIRNAKGVDIASSNSEIEGIEIFSPQLGEYKTIKIKLFVPLLHQGSYSLNMSIGYRELDGKMHTMDSITNIIAFNIESTKKVHVLMSLDTEFTII